MNKNNSDEVNKILDSPLTLRHLIRGINILLWYIHKTSRDPNDGRATQIHAAREEVNMTFDLPHDTTIY